MILFVFHSLIHKCYTIKPQAVGIIVIFCGFASKGESKRTAI